MSHHSRRILTPGASRKRKETEALYSVKPSTSPPPTPTQSAPAQAAAADAESMSSNRLLAGYMAYEFLTKGTLLGQKYDPARAEALPLSSASVDDIKIKRTTKPNQMTEADPSIRSAPPAKPNKSYAEVASLLKTDGAHVAGIINPSQLAQWIQM